MCAGAVATALAGCSSPTDRPAPSRAETPSDPDTSSPTTAESNAEPAASLNGPWPTAHADAGNTGAIEAGGPRGTPSVRWRESIDLGTSTRVTSGPAGPVATQRDGTVLAYAPDGTLRWRHQHDAGFLAAPVVAEDGTVVVGDRAGSVVAYDADGTRRWHHETQDGLFAPHLNDGTPFRIVDGTVVLAHPRGTALAVSLDDGTVQWEVDVPLRSHRPAIARGRVFLTSEPGPGDRVTVVQARSLLDGSEQWRNDVDGSISIGPGVHEGVVYTGGIDGRLIAREASDGSERWRVRIDDDPWISTIPVVFGGRVWVGTLSDGVYGVTETGVLARAAIDAPTTPAVGADRLYVGRGELGSGSADEPTGAVVALDAAGDEVWRTETRGHPESALHYRDGHVLYGTDVGVVERLAATDGTRTWRAFARPGRLPSPVVGPATVYCGSRDSRVGGYRVTDGTSHLWGVSLEGSAPGTPTVAGQSVVAGSDGGEVAGTPLLEHADTPTGRLTPTPTPGPNETPTPHIDAPAPEPRWRTTLSGPVGDVGYGTEYAYLGSGTSLVSLDAEGDVRWETDVGSRVRGAPAVHENAVFAGTTDGIVLAVAAEDGTERWRRTVGDVATAPAVASADGSATPVVGTSTGAVALDAAGGRERWRAETGRVRGPPAIAGESVVLGDETGVLRALAISDATERWRHETGGAIHGSPAVAGQSAYVGSRDGSLYAVSLEDGTERWRVELADWVDGSPAVAYGAVFVVDQSGALTAIVGDR